MVSARSRTGWWSVPQIFAPEHGPNVAQPGAQAPDWRDWSTKRAIRILIRRGVLVPDGKGVRTCLTEAQTRVRNWMKRTGRRMRVGLNGISNGISRAVEERTQHGI